MSDTMDHPGGTQPLGRAELLGVFAFWTVLALLTAANRMADQGDFTLSAVPHAIPIGLAFQQMYVWALLTPLMFWMAGRFNLEQSNTGVKILILVIIGIVIAFSVDLLNSTIVRQFATTPQSPRRASASHVGGGFGRGRGPGAGGTFGVFRGPMILNHFILFWGLLSAGFARDYFLRFRARELETSRLQAETAQLQTQLAEARLSALNAQLNPHFLFNTLHAISSLVERDPRGVRRMIARLSELLRYTLEGGTEHEVMLGQEIAFLERYLEIMQIRFQGQLEIDVQIADEARDALVPSLILQPLVENAVKHGVDKVSGTGKIRILARRESDRLVLSVSDNGPGPQKIARLDEAGVGLANIRQRLEQLYGSAQSLTLADASAGGTVAQIVMPFRTRTEIRTTVVVAKANR
ncbi:MAG TPA: sensor histidine kinase [Gemmatimonadaceae bacterium]|nr:sensor histidine kinase [Gemmatimonadaceae bacterium]